MHEIWSTYTDLVEYISLDEGYLDVTGSIRMFGSVHSIAHEIKQRTKELTGLTCSVGVGYSLMSAKLASEEKKPNGYFEIESPEALRELIIDRPVRIIWGVGEKTADTLYKADIRTVRDIYNNRWRVINLLGNQGRKILELADGVDEREVTPYSDPKSIGKEHTFQEDIIDFDYLKDALLLMTKELSYELHQKGFYSSTITLKITYANMQAITRSKTGEPTNRLDEIYGIVQSLLDMIDKRPVRLAGISLSSLGKDGARQLSLLDMDSREQKRKLDAVTFKLQQKFGKDAIKTGNEMIAEKRFLSDNEDV